jgi:hypothetical protein
MKWTEVFEEDGTIHRYETHFKEDEPNACLYTSNRDVVMEMHVPEGRTADEVHMHARDLAQKYNLKWEGTDI